MTHPTIVVLGGGGGGGGGGIGGGNIVRSHELVCQLCSMLLGWYVVNLTVGFLECTLRSLVTNWIIPTHNKSHTHPHSGYM